MKHLQIALLLIFLLTGISSAKIIIFDSEHEVKKIETNIDSYFKNNPPDYRKRIQDEWYGVYVMGAKAGWMHISVEKITNNNKTYYLTRTSMVAAMKQDETKTQLVQKDETLEDSKGNIVLFFSHEKQGKETKTIQGRGEKNSLTWTISNGMKTVQNQRKLKRKLVGSYEMEQLMKKSGYKPGFIKKVFIFSSKEPGKDMELVLKIQKPETVDILGKKKKLIKVQLIMDMGMTVSMNTWVTSKGVIYKMSMMDFINSYRMPKVLALKTGRILDMKTILK